MVVRACLAGHWTPSCPESLLARRCLRGAGPEMVARRLPAQAAAAASRSLPAEARPGWVPQKEQDGGTNAPADRGDPAVVPPAGSDKSGPAVQEGGRGPTRQQRGAARVERKRKERPEITHVAASGAASLDLRNSDVVLTGLVLHLRLFRVLCSARILGPIYGTDPQACS